MPTTGRRCLVHLLPDAQFAIDCGDRAFAAPLRLLRHARHRHRHRPAPGRLARHNAGPVWWLAQYRADLDRRLDRIMTAVPRGHDGERRRRRIGRDRAHLFVFVTDRDVPATNNTSERHLRPSVIFRKVTNGFRAEWGAETDAAFRSVVSTAKLTGNTVLHAVRNRIVHGYSGIDDSILFVTIEQDVKPLLSRLEALARKHNCLPERP